MLEKAATIKRFEYSPLGSELKKQTGIAKGQYKLLMEHKNVIDNNKENVDNGKGDMSDKSNAAKDFDVILEDIKNNKKVKEKLGMEPVKSSRHVNAINDSIKRKIEKTKT